MIGKAAAKRILETYGKAWMGQDIPLILSIFTEDASYQERVFSAPFKGHNEIAQYWKEKGLRRAVKH